MAVVTIFIAVCAVIGWFRSRGRGGGSWWRLIRALGWGLALLAVSWVALWLFGLNLLTIVLLLLCGGVLVIAPGSRAATAHPSARMRRHNEPPPRPRDLNQPITAQTAMKIVTMSPIPASGVLPAAHPCRLSASMVARVDRRAPWSGTHFPG